MLTFDILKRSRSWFLLAGLVAVTLGSGCTKELRKSRHLSRGDRAFKQEKYDEAEIEYLKVLQAVSMEPTAVRQLGLIYRQQGKLMSAGAYLTKALESDPNNPELRLQLASCEFELGETRKAAANAELVLKVQKGQPDALEIFAACVTSSNGIADVQQQIEKMRKADQDRPSYHVALGTIQLRGQNLTNAEAEFKKALEMDPKCAPALIGLGSLYWSRNDLVHAGESLKTAGELVPRRSIRRLRYPEFLYASGKRDEARAYIEQITKEVPDYLPAWNALAQMAFTEKKYDECASLVSRVLARDPFNLMALMLNGNVKLNKADGPGAVASFTRMASVYKTSPQVQLQLARAYLLNNDLSKALQSLNQAVAFDPNYADAVLLLASLNIRRGEAPQAITALEGLIKRQPNLAQAYLSLIEAYSVKKDPAQALATGREMAKRFPANADVQLVLGSLLFRQNQTAEARKAFETALSIAPAYPLAIEKMVQLDLVTEQYADALKVVQQLADKNPSAAEPYLFFGQIHLAEAQAAVRAANKAGADSSQRLRLKDVSSAQPQLLQAEESFNKACELSPSSRVPHLMLADLYVATDRQQQALDRLNQFLAKTNDVLVLMQSGIINEGLTNYSAAADSYKKILSISPEYSPALNNLAYLYSEHLGDLESASKMAEKVRRLLPKDPSIADTYGWIMYRRGDYARALEALQQSVSAVPNQPEVVFHLGMTQYMLGNEPAASQALRFASQSNKSFGGKELAAGCLRILAINPKSASQADVADLQKALERNPSDPVALVRLGGVQERDGAFDRAAAMYEKALKTNPKSPNLALNLARLYASPQINDPAKALILAKEAHETAPDDPVVSALLGRLVYASGDYKWATSLLEGSAGKLPDDPSVTYDFALACYSVGRAGDATRLMEKVAASTEPTAKVGEAKQFLTMVSAAEGSAQAGAAVDTAQRLIKSNPKYVPALMVLAVASESQGAYPKAASNYQEILSIYPQFSPAARNLGLLYFSRLADDQKSYDLLLKAREAFPQDAQVAKALGVLTYRKGNYSRATQLLAEGAQKTKGDAELLYYLGMAQYQMKAKSESKAALQQALSFDLPTQLAQDAKRVLAELK